MATSTTSRTPLDSPDADRGRFRGVLRTVVVVVVGLVLLGAGTLIGLRMARAGVLPGTQVDGVAVGGLDRDGLTRRLEQLARRKADAEIVALRDDKEVTGTAGGLGYAMDVEATAEQVLYLGRQGNPVAALRDQLRAFGGGTDVDSIGAIDDESLTAWSEQAAADLERKPREGGVRFDGANVERRDPRPGALVDEADLAAQARDLLPRGTGGLIEVSTEPTEPVTTEDDVDAVVELAERAVSEPVTFTRSGNEATLSAEDIGGVLSSRISDDGEIVLRADADAVRAAIGDEAIARFEQGPQSASFDITGGSIQLIKGTRGFTYDDVKAAKQLVEVATGDAPRTVKLDGTVEAPDLSSAEARNLDIVEKVSEFTTYHACCESRVTNIHRIADIVDDVVIEPGETFSVNGFVGERTEAKGFVGGGAISDGQFVEQVGGGVSQFATTTYNAAYFGGYEIVEHKAHSYYISRYPVGREATLNYPDVDLKIKNNSPHGMVIDTSYTDESITVAVYGKKWVDVDSETGPRVHVKSPTTVYRENNDLPQGDQRVVQEAGADGFDITVTRILTFPDGTTKREEVTTTYLAQPRIVERNT